MRKQEYIHLHALFVELTKYLLEEEVVTREVLKEYNEMETHSRSMQKSKEAHHEAVMILTRNLDQAFDDQFAEQPEPSSA